MRRGGEEASKNENAKAWFPLGVKSRYFSALNRVYFLTLMETHFII